MSEDQTWRRYQVARWPPVIPMSHGETTTACLSDSPNQISTGDICLRMFVREKEAQGHLGPPPQKILTGPL